MRSSVVNSNSTCRLIIGSRPAILRTAPGKGRARRQIRSAAVPDRIPPVDLLVIAEKAARAGAQVVLAAADRPRNITSKHGLDIVTDTDKASEAACVAAIRAAFPQHAILAEEGGVSGDVTSSYLWCCDPLDGTINFAHGYRGFCVSVGVLRHALPVAGCVIEFTGGPGDWSTRVYAASRNGGATCNGNRIAVSGVDRLSRALTLTEMSWNEELWNTSAQLYKHFALRSQGVRSSGAAATNLCHVAAGVADAYWQYSLKPWDVAAGVLILEEAGGRVTTCDGLAYSVFDRSLLATNDAVYSEMLRVMEPKHANLLNQMVDMGPWCIPEGYQFKSGAQLD